MSQIHDVFNFNIALIFMLVVMFFEPSTGSKYMARAHSWDLIRIGRLAYITTQGVMHYLSATLRLSCSSKLYSITCIIDIYLISTFYLIL